MALGRLTFRTAVSDPVTVNLITAASGGGGQGEPPLLLRLLKPEAQLDAGPLGEQDWKPAGDPPAWGGTWLGVTIAGLTVGTVFLAGYLAGRYL